MMTASEDLLGRNLCNIDLSGQDLSGLDLRGFVLTPANLQRTCLRKADLRGADLRGANLEWACLEGARLEGIQVNWSSYDLLAQIIENAAEGRPDRLALAGLIRTCRHWCWDDFMTKDVPCRPWGLSVLRKWATEKSPMPPRLLGAHA